MKAQLCFKVILWLAALLLITSPLLAAPVKLPFIWRNPIVFPEHKPELPGEPGGSVRRIDRAADGGAYLVGTTQKTNEIVPFVVKVDGAGNTVWGQTYNLKPLEVPYCLSPNCSQEAVSKDSLAGVRLVEKGDGDAVLVATHRVGLGPYGQTLVLITLDTAGNEIGRRECGAAPGLKEGGKAWVNDVLFPPDGTLVMVGGISSADQLTEKSYAAKVDLAGNLLWAVNLGEGKRQEGTVLDAGGVAIWSVLGDIPLVVIDDKGYLTYKVDTIDASGNIVQTEQRLAPDNHYMVPSPDGGYFHYTPNTTFDETLGSPDGLTHHITVGHTSPSGVVDWSQAYAFPGQWNWYNKLESAPDGGVLLSGGGQCASNTGFEYRAIRVAPHARASWAGSFADCSPGVSGPFETQWSSTGGFLVTTLLSDMPDKFIGLLPAKPQSGTFAVGIDAQPASVANTVNLTRDSLLTVTIWSRPDFDARDIDPATVTVAGAPVLLKKAGYAVSSRDLNRDGLADLAVSIPVNRLSVSPGLNHVKLQGTLKNGVAIYGEDILTVK